MNHRGLTVERQMLPSGLRFALSGELDLLNVGTVGTVLREEIDARSCDVEIDLAELSFLGLAGVDMFDDIGRCLADAGRHLRISASNGTVERVFAVRRALASSSRFPALRDGLTESSPVVVPAMVDARPRSAESLPGRFDADVLETR